MKQLLLPEIKVEIKDLPAITNNMAEVKEYALKVKNHYENLVISDDMINAIKKEKAMISKAEDQVATYRKNTVKLYKKPLEEFESNAKEAERLLEDAYNACNTAVKRYEDNLKAEKQVEIVTHFNHLKAKYGLDFIVYEDCHIKVGLSDSLKSLKSQVENYLMKIVEELNTIDGLTVYRSEILAEYKLTKNLAQSIATVNERQARIEAENKRLAEYQEQIVKEEEKQEELNKVQEEYIEPVIEEPKQILTMTFTVKGTLDQLKAVKNFMDKEGISYGK